MGSTLRPSGQAVEDQLLELVGTYSDQRDGCDLTGSEAR
jgi:hypothetical protein